MGKWDELGHIAPAVYSCLQKMVQHPSVNGNVDTLASLISNSICDKLSLEDSKENLNEDYDVMLLVGEMLQAYIKKALKQVLTGPKDQSFSDFQLPLRNLMEEAVGNMMEELRDAFKGGEEDVWKWVT